MKLLVQLRIEETKKKRTVHVMTAEGEERSYDIPLWFKIKS